MVGNRTRGRRFEMTCCRLDNDARIAHPFTTWRAPFIPLTIVSSNLRLPAFYTLDASLVASFMLCSTHPSKSHFFIHSSLSFDAMDRCISRKLSAGYDSKRYYIGLDLTVFLNY